MGYETTQVLPLVALSMFSYYEKNLLEVQSKEEYLKVVNITLDLNVLEMINIFLFE